MSNDEADIIEKQEIKQEIKREEKQGEKQENNDKLETTSPIDNSKPPSNKEEIHNPSILFPTDSEIPLYIRSDVKKLEKEAYEIQRQSEVLRNRLDLKINFKNSEKSIHVSRTNTLKELFDIIWVEFSLFLEPEFKNKEIIEITDIENPAVNCGNNEIENQNDDADKSEITIDNTVIKPGLNYYENTRLRFYNVTTKIATDVFDTKTPNKTLELCNFTSFRSLLLDIKNDVDQFEVYYTDGLSISLEGYDTKLNNFGSVRTVRLPKKSTLGALRRVVGPWVDYPEEKIRYEKDSKNMLRVTYERHRCLLLLVIL